LKLLLSPTNKKDNPPHRRADQASIFISQPAYLLLWRLHVVEGVVLEGLVFKLHKLKFITV
jgi:hypothetical protein